MVQELILGERHIWSVQDQLHYDYRDNFWTNLKFSLSLHNSLILKLKFDGLQCQML